jgi:cysteine desulfuration protein SufE
MTINEIQDTIIKEFSSLDDWFDRYEKIIEIGKKLPVSIENFKTEKNALQGCQSQVWISAQYFDEKIIYTADSDSIIIKGIIALLLRVLNNQSPSDIINADLYFLSKIGLNTNLSPARATGISSILREMRRICETYLR